MSVSRVAGPPQIGHVVWHRHDAVVGAVDHRDGAAPEALARDQPVAQSVVDLADPDPLLLEPHGGALLGRRDVQAVEPGAVDLLARARVGPTGSTVGTAVLVPALGRPHGAHVGQTVGLGEVPVPGVLRRHGHDRPGAVPHEHVVGDIDRHRGACEGVHHRRPGERAPLGQAGGARLGQALDVGRRGGAGAELGHRRGVLGRGQLVDHRVLGGDDGVGHAERGVGTGGEDPQGEWLPSVGSVAPVDHQVELGPLGAADPVPLHRLDPLGPLQLVEAGQELVGVLRDPEEPLLQVPLDDQVARTLARAVGQHLLVGQDRLAAGAPVDRGVGPVGQAGLEELGEDDLVPLDVLGIVAADLAAPVVDGAQRGDGLLQLLDAGVGEDPGMGAGLDGGVFRRQAERVEAERGQDRVPEHGAVADQQVAEGVVAHVAHVGRTRRVRVHREDVPGRARVVGVHLIGALVAPATLPLLLDPDDVVGPCHGGRSYRAQHAPPAGTGHRARPGLPAGDPVDRRPTGASASG